MSHSGQGSGPPWTHIVNDNSNYNYNYNPGGNITNLNNNSIHNYVVASETTPNALATIEKVLGWHHLPGATFEAQLASAGCMPGTRVQFLKQVLALLTAHTGPHIVWIAGMAGTGKTSIALTLCRLLKSDTTVLLGGSFFCSRSTGTVERTDVQRIVPTLATKLARQFPDYASALRNYLSDEPDVAHWSVRAQVDSLFALPLAELTSHDGQIVFVIDALDECSDQMMLAELIDTLAEFKSPLPVKFLLTSRPEMYIRQTPISNPNFSSILQLHTVDLAQVEADLCFYVGRTFAKASGSTLWYTQRDVEALAQRSCGLFIFASTVIKYILVRSNADGRKDRLQKVTTAVSRGTASTAALDKIYELVLTEASRPDQVDDDELEDTKCVLACILNARASLSIVALAELMEVTPANLRGALDRLHSLVHVPDDDSETGIRTLHAFFSDYLFDRAASQIRILATLGHGILARGCLHRMAQDDLCFNISHSQSSFEPTPDEAPDWIPLSLMYTCIHWAHHLNAASHSPSLDQEVDRVLKQKLLFWLEVLSVLKKISVASGLLRIACLVVKQQIVAQFLREANSFVVSSYDAIARSAPHIYLSALPFTGKGSLVRQYFAPQCAGVISAETFGIADHGEGLTMILTGHKDYVTSISYSLDGLNLASGSDDRTVRVWDTRTGEETMSAIHVDHGFVLAIAFVLCDRAIAVCSSDGLMRIRDISTGHDLQYWLCDVTTRVTRVSFSPDRTLVASVSWDGKVQIRSVSNGDKISVLRGPISRPTKISFSCNDRLAAAFLDPPVIRIWISHTGLFIGDINSTGQVLSLAISPDGKVIVAYPDQIEVWDLGTMTRVSVSNVNIGSTCSLALSPDVLHLIAISSDSIRFWNWHTKEEVALFQGHSDQINSVTYSPDGRYVASASSDCTIRIWDIRSSREVVQPLPEPSQVTCIAVSPDSTYIVSGASDGSVRIWSAQNGEPTLGPLVGHQGRIDSIAISSNGRWIASLSHVESRCVVCFWHAQTGESAGELIRSFVGYVIQAAVSPDTLQLASIVLSAEEIYATVHLWSLGTESPSVLGEFQRKSSSWGGYSITFSCDGSLLAATVGEIGQVHIWQMPSGQLLGAPLETGELAIYSFAFSRDSTRIVISTEKDTHQTWDINTGRLVFDNTEDQSEYTSKWLKYSPNGRSIVRMSIRSRYAEVSDAVITTISRNSTDNITSAADATDRPFIVIGGDDRITVWRMDAVNTLAAQPRCNTLAELLRTGPRADGWVTGPSGELLLWVPPAYRAYVQLPPCTIMISKHRVVLSLNANNLRSGSEWTSCWSSAATVRYT